MKTNTVRNLFATLIAISVIAAGANAFAGKGMGNQDGSRSGDGYGRGDCRYGQMNANLTDEQRAQIDAERNAYFEATREERQDLFAKRLALKAEIAKRQPDAKAAENLQKDISEIQTRLDQKRLKHIMAIQKINPDAARGYFMDGRGHHGKGRGMGNGPGDCPFR